MLLLQRKLLSVPVIRVSKIGGVPHSVAEIHRAIVEAE